MIGDAMILDITRKTSKRIIPRIIPNLCLIQVNFKNTINHPETVCFQEKSVITHQNRLIIHLRVLNFLYNNRQCVWGGH